MFTGCMMALNSFPGGSLTGHVTMDDSMGWSVLCFDLCLQELDARQEELDALITRKEVFEAVSLWACSLQQCFWLEPCDLSHQRPHSLCIPTVYLIWLVTGLVHLRPVGFSCFSDKQFVMCKKHMRCIQITNIGKQFHSFVFALWRLKVWESCSLWAYRVYNWLND